MRWLIFLALLFTPLYPHEADRNSPLYLSLNMGNGEVLQLSNGKAYEIAPEDRLYSAYWITPFPLEITESGDPDYPVKITNLNSGSSVSGKEVDMDTLLKRSAKKDRELQREKQRRKHLEPHNPSRGKPKAYKQEQPSQKWSRKKPSQTQKPKPALPKKPPKKQTPGTHSPRPKPKASQKHSISKQEHFNR